MKLVKYSLYLLGFAGVYIVAFVYLLPYTDAPITSTANIRDALIVAGMAGFSLVIILEFRNFRKNRGSHGFVLQLFTISVFLVTLVYFFSVVILLLDTRFFPQTDLILPVGEIAADDIGLMVIDQMTKGALFDALEVFDYSLSSFRPNPKILWFSGLFVLLRVFVSIYVIGAILTMFGWSRNTS